MSLKHRLNQIKYYFTRYGFLATVKKCVKRAFGIKDAPVYTDNEVYEKWIEHNEPDGKALREMASKKFEIQPLISVVVPMYNTNEKYFSELIDCMQKQIYTNWELCLADGSDVKNQNLEDMTELDNRIFYKYIGENKGISGNSNEALSFTNGEYIALLDHDDLIPENALYEFIKAINLNRMPDFLYSDEDKITDEGKRYNPYFKPDFSPETLAVHNYITHLVMFKKVLLDEVGMFNEEFDGAQDYDLVLRLTEKAKKIVHISKILYHWRAGDGSTAEVAGNKPYAFEAGKRAVEAHIKRLGKEGTVEDGQDVPRYL